MVLCSCGWTTSMENNPVQNDYSHILGALDNPDTIVSLQQLSQSFGETFSSSNVKSFIDGVAKDLQNQYGNIAAADPLDIAINLLLESNEERYKKLEAKIRNSGDDIKAIVKLINHEIGADLLSVNDVNLSLNAHSLTKLFQKMAFDFIKNNFPDNFFLQLSLTKLVRDETAKSAHLLQSFLEDKTLPLNDLKNILAATSVIRSKRSLDILGSLIEAARPLLSSLLAPIQTQVNNVFETVSDFVLSFYVSNDTTNAISSAISNVTNNIVLQAVEIVGTVQDYVNVFFNNVLHGNGTSTSTTTSTEGSARRRREVSFQNSLLNFDQYGNSQNLDKSRSINIFSWIITILRNLISPFTTWINSFVKQLFVNFLSNYYVAIGKLVTYPLRYVFQLIVNLILPCSSSCTSIL